jgi:hypothetical protein
VCGFQIPLADFTIWRDTLDARYAICGRCGAPAALDDASFVVVDRALGHLPPPEIGVDLRVDGGWRATCDCGLTAAVATQVSGWDWILDHECMPPAP